MGRREEQRVQESLWIAHTELARAPGHPFYEKLNELLDAEGFDGFVEGLSAKFYAKKFGRSSLLPGIYFRSLSIGYFEGIEALRFQQLIQLFIKRMPRGRSQFRMRNPQRLLRLLLFPLAHRHTR